MGAVTKARYEIDELLERLKEAVRQARAQARKTGPAYGAVVLATCECLKARVKRKKISALIAQAWGEERMNDKPLSKGRAARYVRLARWELGQWLHGEVKPSKPVKIGDQA